MSDDNKQRGSGPGDNGGGPSPNPWMKSLLIWVAILLGMALFVTTIDGRQAAGGGDQIAYSAFLDKVDEGSVRDVNISRDIITGTTTSGEKFRAYPIQDATLVPKLREKGVTISAKPEDGPSIWMVLLYQSLPFLLFLGIAFFVLRQMQKGGGANGAMGFGKSRAKLLTQKEGKVTFDDVAGIDEAREELQEVVEFLKDPTKFARLGGKIPKGALLVGSPGTGKTLLARDMVTKWGMSDKVGPVEYAQPEGESFLGYSSSQPVRMSNATAQLIDDEIKSIVEGGLARAKSVLSEHIDQLHLLAGALLEYETLSGDEIKKLVAGEDLGRPDPGAKAGSVPAAGTSIPKTRRPTGPFGNPTPLGA